MPTNRDDIRDFLNRRKQVVLVEVEAADGSTPREAGAWMLVAADCIFGTIGGGQLEFMAIDHARRALESGAQMNEITIPLGPEIGQCCGGRVSLGFKRVDRAVAMTLIEKVDLEIAQRPHVYVFGAGHVGDALAMALSLVPLRTILVDTREEELSATQVPGIETCLTAMPEAVVRDAPAGSAFVVLTHDHALDFLITAEALARNDASYVGMIGSKTKRATFRNWLTREVGRPEFFDRLVCPVGGTAVKDKRPTVIAALAAAEIMVSALNYRLTPAAAPKERRRVQRLRSVLFQHCVDQALTALGHEIDHQPDLWILKPLVRVDRGKLNTGWRRVFEDRFQRPVIQMAFHFKQRFVDDAATLERPLCKYIAIIGIIRAADFQLASTFGHLQRPEIFFGTRIAQQQAIMMFGNQVIGR